MPLSLTATSNVGVPEVSTTPTASGRPPPVAAPRPSDWKALADVAGAGALSRSPCVFVSRFPTPTYTTGGETPPSTTVSKASVPPLVN